LSTESAPTIRAGFIPYSYEGGQVQFLFMKPSDPAFGGDAFQIAKGYIERGESSLFAAREEAREELGLKPSNLIGQPAFLGTYDRMDVYICEVKSQADFDEPHYETGATAWMTLLDFESTGRDIHVPIVRAAAEYLLVNSADRVLPP
jgi:8-oxo-dGTP pyrophosphatase MutT (NUDIX family)